MTQKNAVMATSGGTNYGFVSVVRVKEGRDTPPPLAVLIVSCDAIRLATHWSPLTAVLCAPNDSCSCGGGRERV